LTKCPGHIAPRTAGILLTFFLIAFRAPGLRAQAANTETEPRALVDVPTAGMLRSGAKAFQTDFYHSDGIDAGFFYGLTDRLMVGISYGGTDMIGTQSPRWNDVPGFLVRVRVFEESTAFPAICLGFESQGADGYIDDANRFSIKSPGLYLVMSKSYDATGYLGFHGGVNYSLEHDDGDRSLNLFGGIDKSIGSFLALTGEYNVAWNDNGPNSLGRGRGYLNAGVSIFPGAGITLALQFKDLLENQPHEGFANRTLRIEFTR
jgi:hypothetical protein